MGLIDDEGLSKEAFFGAILTYKLLVQTIRIARVCFALSDWSLAMASSTQPQDYDLKILKPKPQPSYPAASPTLLNGIPFTFWKQYIGLEFHLLLALAAAFAAVFLLISLLLVSPLAVSVIW